MTRLRREPMELSDRSAPVGGAIEFAVCLGFDAFRIAVGKRPKLHPLEDIIRWLRLMDARDAGDARMDSEYKQYRRTQFAEMRPYRPGETLSDRVSISEAEREAGSPREGDMIARNPDNHDDQWLVAKAYFEKNFEP